MQACEFARVSKNECNCRCVCVFKCVHVCNGEMREVMGNERGNGK